MIAPGHTEGERVEKVIKERAEAAGKTFDEMQSKFLIQYKLGKLIKPEDIAELVVFLTTSNVGQKITGETYYVRSGFRL